MIIKHHILKHHIPELRTSATVDFRNFIAFFGAETLAHWNPTSCQKKTSTINLFAFETLKLKIRRLKLWKATIGTTYWCKRPTNDNIASRRTKVFLDSKLVLYLRGSRGLVSLLWLILLLLVLLVLVLSLLHIISLFVIIISLSPRNIIITSAMSPRKPRPPPAAPRRARSGANY